MLVVSLLMWLFLWLFICGAFLRTWLLLFFKLSRLWRIWILSTLHKKQSFPLRISSVNVTKSAGNCRFGHIYWRNPNRRLHFLCSGTRYCTGLIWQMFSSFFISSNLFLELQDKIWETRKIFVMLFEASMR